jgi:hypothetical protein
MPFAWAGAAAAVVSAGVGVAGAVGGASGASGAISAGQAEANAALAPYSTTGAKADTQQANLLGLNGQPAADTSMSTFRSSPGYQYSVSQGLRAVDNGAAAKGILRSGATLRGEQTLGANLADQDFGSYITRLNSLTNFGVTAAGGQASTDTSAAGAQANIVGNEAKGITSALGGLAGNTSAQNGLTSLGSGSPIAGQPSDFAGQTVNTSGWGNATGGNSG